MGEKDGSTYYDWKEAFWTVEPLRLWQEAVEIAKKEEEEAEEARKVAEEARKVEEAKRGRRQQHNNYYRSHGSCDMWSCQTVSVHCFYCGGHKSPRCPFRRSTLDLYIIIMECWHSG
jgi:hypothetical protein